MRDDFEVAPTLEGQGGRCGLCARVLSLEAAMLDVASAGRSRGALCARCIASVRSDGETTSAELARIGGYAEAWTLLHRLPATVGPQGATAADLAAYFDLDRWRLQLEAAAFAREGR